MDLLLVQNLAAWLCEKKREIVIIPHVNPDGDALGSSLGLQSILINAGHHAVVIFPNDFPVSFHGWTDTHSDWLIWERNERRCEAILKNAEILFFLDFNDIKRMGKIILPEAASKIPSVMIDHHPDPILKTDFQFSDTRVCSTAELVFEVIEQMNLDQFINAQGAQALLTGIIADTGGFSHNASRSSTYRIVARLLDAGAQKEVIQEMLFNNFSELRMRLLGHCLSEKMELFPQYRTALIWLKEEELKRYNFQNGDTEGFVNYPLSINGIIFSAFFMEKGDYVKISFRSKGSFATNLFSGAHFKGGGHRNASGGESSLPMDEALALFRSLLPSYQDELNKDF